MGYGRKNLHMQGNIWRGLLIPISPDATKSLADNKGLRIRISTAIVQSMIPRGFSVEDLGARKTIDALKIDFSLSVDGYSLILGSGHSCDIRLRSSFCWVHAVHAQLIPHSCEQRLSLLSKASTLFTVERMQRSTRADLSFRSHAADVLPGIWQIELGDGLRFSFVVFQLPAATTLVHPNLLRAARSHRGSSNSPPNYSSKSRRQVCDRKLRLQSLHGSSSKINQDSDTSLALNVYEEPPARFPTSGVKNSTGTLRQSHSSTVGHEADPGGCTIEAFAGSVDRISKLGADTVAIKTESASHTQKSPIADAGRVIAIKPSKNIFVVDYCKTKAVRKEFCRVSEGGLLPDNYVRERDTLVQLASDHIVKLYCWDDARPSLTIELIPGKDVSAFTDNDKLCTLSNVDALAILHGASAGIAHIHSKGFVHRDIKAENLMYDEIKQVVKVIDFDHASNGNRFTLCGTPSYIPPEFLAYSIFKHSREPARLHRAGDIWGLGIVMLFVLRFIKRPDFTIIISELESEPEPQAMFTKWLNFIRERIRQLPPSWIILESMLERNPLQRITSSLLVNALEKKSVMEAAHFRPAIHRCLISPAAELL